MSQPNGIREKCKIVVRVDIETGEEELCGQELSCWLHGPMVHNCKTEFSTELNTLEERIKEADFELTPLQQSMKAGWSEIDANRIEARGEGYKLALEDTLSLLEELKNKYK